MTMRSSFAVVAAMVALAGCASSPETSGPDHLEMDAVSASLAVGESMALSATFRDHTGAVMDDGGIANAVTWSSSDPAHVTVRGDGARATLTAVTAGSATISATSDGLTATAAVTVRAAAELVTIDVAPGAADIAIAGNRAFTASGTFSDGTTLDITASVAWSSSDPDVATISAGGLATGVAAGSAVITAQQGAVTGATTAQVVAAAVGPWIAAAGFTGRPCHDAVKFSMASDRVYVCTTATGLVKGTVASDLSISFAPVDLGAGALAGLAVATHPQNPTTVMYMTAPSGTANNWFRSNDGVAFTPFSLLDSAGSGRSLYAGRFQMGGLGNVLGSWDPGSSGTPQATVLAGNFQGSTGPSPRAVGNATGTVRAIAGSSATNLYVAVLGETPAGAPATGGVFRSTDSAVTWIETDTGIAAADRDRIATVTIDPTTPATLYAGVRGGARVYKTTNAGTTWTASGTGIPSDARVEIVYVSPQTATTVFAATDRGLYRSTDAGATWTLAGFDGRVVTGIAQSSANAALILVSVDDEVGLYRAQ